MGASSSVLANEDGYHIHISLSSKYVDDNQIIMGIVSKLRQTGFRVTITDPTFTTKEICETLKSANVVIYCTTQNYGVCGTQAMEFSYLAENDKISYNIIIDRYENRVFAKHIQGFLQGRGWEMSSVEDIPLIVNDINHNALLC